MRSRISWVRAASATGQARKWLTVIILQEKSRTYQQIRSVHLPSWKEFEVGFLVFGSGIKKNAVVSVQGSLRWLALICFAILR
jgi:hypothetical protein